MFDTESPTHRDVLEEVNRIIFNVIGDEEIVHHSQESHLRNGEDVHELLHLWPLGSKTQFNA